MAAVERHFGEIIREGSVCRLYFDMEFGISEGVYMKRGIPLVSHARPLPSQKSP
jgi:hypothetical protein